MTQQLPSRHALVRYFSGTGNTARAGGIVADELRRCGWNVSVEPMEAAAAAGPVDMFVLGFPVYACDVPALVVRHLRRLPRVEGTRAAVIATRGEVLLPRFRVPGYEGHALARARALLLLKGYDVFFTDVFDYPFNASSIGWTPTPEAAAKLLARGDKQASAAGRLIAAGTPRLRRFSWLNRIWTVPFGRSYSSFGRFGIGKLYAADPRCTSCGLCARTCPAGAVRLVNGIPRWTWHCQGCHRCINICPVASIQTSLARLLLTAALQFAPLLTLVLRLIDGHRARIAGVTLPPGVEVLLWAAGYAGMSLMLDVLLDGLARLRTLRPLLSAGHTRRVRRYLAPGYEPPTR